MAISTASSTVSSRLGSSTPSTGCPRRFCICSPNTVHHPVPAADARHGLHESFEPIFEVAAGSAQLHAFERLAGHGPLQEFVTDRRQHGVGQDGVDHPAAAFDFAAPADDQL